MGYELLSGNELGAVLGAYDLVGSPFNLAARGAAPRFAMLNQQAAAPVPQAMANPIQQAAAQKLVQAGAIIREQQPTKSRRLYLPMVSNGTIAAAASQTITARPQSIAFKPQRVVVPASIAPDFTIDTINVGVKPQAVQTGSVSAETFVADAVDCDMDMDTVQTSQDFILGVTNISGAARTFRATVYGRSADI